MEASPKRNCPTSEFKQLAAVRVAYADPPYIGQAKKHYSADPNCGEVDHVELIQKRLAVFDGWALSCHVNSLGFLLNLCPPDVRVMAWVKPFASFKKNVNPTYAWEPVIVKAPRRLQGLFIHDWVSCCPQFGSQIMGQKPQEFCFWLFECLALRDGDEFVDLYPGSGAVTTWFKIWKSRLRFPEAEGSIGGSIA